MANKAVGLLTFNFGANMQGFEKAMNKAEKKLKKFGRNITATGQSLSLGLTLPIAALGATAIKLGSDFEETDSKFKTVFSSIQDEAEKTADVFKDSFGLSEKAAKTLLSSTGDLLVGFGFTETAALDLSKRVNELSVDLASFTNFEGGAEGASQALTKALLGERESIKSLGIAITETDLKGYAADHGLVWKELDRVTKAELTFELAAKQSSKAIGDFDRTSDSFANQLRVVTGDLEDLAVEMGQIMLPTAKKVIQWVKGLIKTFSDLSTEQKENIIKWAAIVGAIGPVLIIFGKLATGGAAVISMMKKVSALIVTQPWIAIAAVIAAASIAIYDYATALDAAEQAQVGLTKAKANAAAEVANEIDKLNQLHETATDITKTDEDRQTAIDGLNTKVAAFTGTLNLQNIQEKEVIKTLNEHTDALIHQAEIAELTTMITDQIQKQARIKMDPMEVWGDMSYLERSLAMAEATIKSGGQMKNMQEAIRVVGKKYIDEALVEGETKLKIYREELDKITKSYEEMGIVIEDVAQDQTDLTSSFTGDPIDPDKDKDKKKDSPFDIDIAALKENYQLALNADKENLLNKLITQKEFNDRIKDEEIGHLEQMKMIYEAYGEDIIDIDGEILDSKLSNYEKLEESMDTMQESMARIIEMAAAELKQGAENFEEYGDKVKNVIRESISALIAEGVAGAVSKALSTYPAPAGLIIAALAAGAAVTLFNTLVPAFAEGGLVTGPTMGLIGEGPGTSASNPEVVAPLDKLKGMMGGGSAITVTGRLVGNDIYLSNEKTKFNRGRTT